MTSQPGSQATTGYKYCPLSHKAKGDQAVRFGHLLEYNKINIFSEIKQKM